MSASSFEMFIHVDVLALLVWYLAETIQVELSDEGGEVFVGEVFWKDLQYELGNVFDLERIA